MNRFLQRLLGRSKIKNKTPISITAYSLLGLTAFMGAVEYFNGREGVLYLLDSNDTNKQITDRMQLFVNVSSFYYLVLLQPHHVLLVRVRPFLLRPLL